MPGKEQNNGQNKEKKQEEVKKINLDNLVDKNAEQQKSLMVLHADVEELEFSEKELKFTKVEYKSIYDMVERVEEKLETTDQKNTFRAIVNGFATGEILSLRNYDFLWAVKGILDGGRDATTFTSSMRAIAEWQKGEFANQTPKTQKYTDLALEYSAVDGRKHKEIMKKNQEEFQKKREEDIKANVREERMKDVKLVKAPPITKVRAEWFRVLSERAQSARGLLSDSPQYMAFKAELDAMRDLSDVYYRAKKANKNSVRLAAFDFNGKVKLQKYVQNGVVTMENLQKAYEETWKDIQKTALEYEKYKLDEKGFTRDARKKRGKKLDSSGRMKFELIDTVLFRDAKTKTKKADNTAKSM